MITPRATRLVRVADLHAFRTALVDLSSVGRPFDARARMVVVPTRAARSYLIRSIEDARLVPGGAVLLPDVITPAELPARFAERLATHVRTLGDAEREVLLAAACRAAVESGAVPPFELRAGLIAEILAFYDTLRRHQKDVGTFERLTLGALEPGAAGDRGAERLVRQTRFLAEAFREFERRCAATGCLDEHGLRDRVLSGISTEPWRHVVLAVGDTASDSYGLAAADWDLLARVPGLERLDVVATDTRVAGAFHERIHRWLPGIEEVRFDAGDSTIAPRLLVAADGSVAHAARDREEEVAGFARLVRSMVRRPDGPALDRTALVVRRPLPYVYLAREILASAGVPYQMFDALPLAAEPYAAALDLVLAFVSGQGARGPAIALLRSPHFRFVSADGVALDARDVAALDKALSEAGYLGELDALERLIAAWQQTTPERAPARAVRASAVLLRIASELQAHQAAAACAAHLDVLLAFLRRHEALPGPDDPLRARQLRARAAVVGTLIALREAHARFDPEPRTFDVVASMVRRWIDGQTFAPRMGEAGVHLVDADSAPFGAFDAVQLAGVVDGEWPVRPRRNIFYSPGILRDLGWPVETERLEAARAAFRDLLQLPSSWLRVSAFQFENDALVARSALCDEVDAAQFETQVEAPPSTRIFQYEAMGLDPVALAALPAAVQPRAERRLDQWSTTRGRAPGRTAGFTPRTFSVSALERYQDCPFKYFAADVLALEEPPDDETSLSPRARGRFIHEVFHRFFQAWDRDGTRTITPDRVDEARALFEEIAVPLLARLPDADAALERARLFGSAIAVGIVDVVLGVEAVRPAEVRERWLEYRLDGEFALGGSDDRRVALRGVADRIDLLAGDRLRVIDYKSGYAPNPARALQVPVYALCAQDRLAERGQAWRVDEASYVAFAGKRALVPVVKAGSTDPAATLAAARERLFAVVDGVRDGEFPPRPYEMRICGYCAYPSVCRKDYVGDE